MKKRILCLALGAAMVLTSSCSSGNSELNLSAETKGATNETIKINSAVYSELDFEDTSEYECATKGLIDAPEELEITDKDGNVVWSQKAYSFVDNYEEAPDTVNPSLWQNTVNNHAYGLFEVVEGIYQVRGYDMANLTLIKGDTGWIVYDTLMSVECAEAAMQLVEKNLGSFPVKAIILSHPHVDHFGGILGIVSIDQLADPNLSLEQQLESGKIPVIAPQGFSEYSKKENLYAGTAMQRRAMYQYGANIDASETGKVAMGIGMGQSVGKVSEVNPTYEITQTGETYIIDGVTMEFQLTPGTEAPAEMNTWFPEFNALWVAENCNSTLHNLYTLRGAEIRDGKAWADYLTETVSLYGDKVEVAFQSHNWPHWGNDDVNEYLTNTAAAYRFIHDQTLTYINQGYTSDEISNMIELPEELAKVWYTRQYYGTVAHNSKAVYQKYMGWYDANPVNLNPLEPTESAKKWVEYLGDTDEVLRKAKEDYDKGEYQWVAEVTNVLVFADPENTDARYLCADALEQLGYQAESGTWRNSYLSAADELRNGNQAKYADGVTRGISTFMGLSAEQYFDYISILLDKQALADKEFTINVTITDTNEKMMIHFKNGAMLQYPNYSSDSADLTITAPTADALSVIYTENMKGINAALKLEGNIEIMELIVNNLNQFNPRENPDFNIVEP